MTVGRVQCSMGDDGAAMDVDQAIEAGWQYLLREEMDVPFAGIVTFVRSLSPAVTPARIRAEFTRRLRARYGLAPERPAEAPDCAAVASPLEDVAHLDSSPFAAASCSHTAGV